MESCADGFEGVFTLTYDSMFTGMGKGKRQDIGNGEMGRRVSCGGCWYAMGVYHPRCRKLSKL